MSLTKREIAVEMAKELDFRQVDTMAAVQFVLDRIKSELLNGGNVELRNFGVFEVATRRPRIGRNPNKPGKDVIIPARNVIKFRMGKEFKDKLNPTRKSGPGKIN